MNINEKYNDNLVESNKYTKQSRQYCVDTTINNLGQQNIQH